jgi:two-component system OmpR family sensor kinase
MPLHIETVSVAALVEQSLEEFGWHHPDVSVEVDVEPETLLVAVDQILMHRVVANLLENAVRHGAPPFRVAAHLGPEAAPSGGRTVVIEVSDHGPGIPPDDAARVFDRFQRLDRSRRSGGSGLGLAIVAGIVERHHGQISVAPVRPHGVRMVITLPQGQRTAPQPESIALRS